MGVETTQGPAKGVMLDVKSKTEYGAVSYRSRVLIYRGVTFVKLESPVRSGCVINRKWYHYLRPLLEAEGHPNKRRKVHPCPTLPSTRVEDPSTGPLVSAGRATGG